MEMTEANAETMQALEDEWREYHKETPKAATWHAFRDAWLSQHRKLKQEAQNTRDLTAQVIERLQKERDYVGLLLNTTAPITSRDNETLRRLAEAVNDKLRILLGDAPRPSEEEQNWVALNEEMGTTPNPHTTLRVALEAERRYVDNNSNNPMGMEQLAHLSQLRERTNWHLPDAKPVQGIPVRETAQAVRIAMGEDNRRTDEPPVLEALEHDWAVYYRAVEMEGANQIDPDDRNSIVWHTYRVGWLAQHGPKAAPVADAEPTYVATKRDVLPVGGIRLTIEVEGSDKTERFGVLTHESELSPVDIAQQLGLMVENTLRHNYGLYAVLR